MNKLLSGNCYFTVPPFAYCLRLDPSGLPPMVRAASHSSDPSASLSAPLSAFCSLDATPMLGANITYCNCRYNIYVRNQITGKYHNIGALVSTANNMHQIDRCEIIWWKSLEWTQAKVIFRKAINGLLHIHYANRCCRCGKIISAENATKGYGPECAKYFEKGGDNIVDESM